jgi:Tol biopolymer transport system component
LAAVLAIPFAPAAGRASTARLISSSADQAPQSSYEIYRLDPNGHRVDLSRSSADDLNPVVSPDGKEVAFFSYRGVPPGKAARIYEVRIDGTHLTNLTPSLDANAHAGSIAWQPHGDRLAAITDTYRGPNAIWILRRGHKPQRVARGGVPEPVWSPPSWSPDGRVLVEWSAHAWRAFSPAGRPLWVHESKNWGGCCGSSWSSDGVLAITTRQQLRVYDENGHQRFEARARTGRVSGPAWSPNGREVAFVSGGVVEVRTENGRLVVRKQLPSLDPNKPNSVVWAGEDRIVAGLPVTGPQQGVDVRTGKPWTASSLWFDPRSADGKLAIVTTGAEPDFSVGVEAVGGGPITTYGTLPPCAQDSPPATSLQFAGRSRSVVYGTACAYGASRR